MHCGPGLFCAAVGLLALMGSVPAPAAPAAGSDTPIPLIVMENVPLTDAIRNLARQANLNYILDPRVAGAEHAPGTTAPAPSVTARWTNLNAQAALRLLLQEHTLTAVPSPATTVTRIVPAGLEVRPVAERAAGAGTNEVIPVIAMDSMPLGAAIQALATKANLKLAVDPQLAALPLLSQGTVSLRWQKLTARQALAALLDNFDLVLVENPAGGSARLARKPPQAPAAAGSRP